ncbi:PAS domain-containing protein [Gluconobacter sp. Dm-62]|uniref:PAS domain-containing protein n=1 Tax=Gluconobacter sp. Dm-62 TaxID=2799804 RepID=UPI001B8BB732|nr:PAS domain-containing protein [Gluconobacter sp. Dm-62]MBS1102287.1 PAS domain-containing protein [Gluconobacter sp. Dm-62]
MGQTQTAPPDISCPAFDLLPDLICMESVGNTGTMHFNTAWKQQAADLGVPLPFPKWLPIVLPADQADVTRVLHKTTPSDTTRTTSFRIRNPDGQYRWFLLRIVQRTLSSSEGAARILILTDIHERKRHEEDLLHKADIRDRMLNVSVDCIKEITKDGTLVHMNTAGCNALGVDSNSGFGMRWLDLLPCEAHTPGGEALRDAAEGQNARFMGVSQLPGQPTRHWDNMLTPLLNPNQTVEAILCVSRDVTTQRENEQRIALLLNELNHRSKNMLAIFQALIRRTVPDPAAPFVKVLEERITSISRSQDLLIHGEWTGATVHDVVTSQTVVAGDFPTTRLRIEGDPALQFIPATADRIGLAIYELTTNAIKYGALSNDTGTVTVSWDLLDEEGGPIFRMCWKENGGPTVKTPDRRGFGSIVIEHNPRSIPGASSSCCHEPDGTVWTFRAPAENVVRCPTRLF